MCHSVPWITCYTVLLEAAQVVYSVGYNSCKRCRYSKEHYTKCIYSVECSEVKLGENISPMKKQQRLL